MNQDGPRGVRRDENHRWVLDLRTPRTLEIPNGTRGVPDLAHGPSPWLNHGTGQLNCEVQPGVDLAPASAAVGKSANKQRRPQRALPIRTQLPGHVRHTRPPGKHGPRASVTGTGPRPHEQRRTGPLISRRRRGRGFFHSPPSATWRSTAEVASAITTGPGIPLFPGPRDLPRP